MKKKRNKRLNENVPAYLFLTPWIIGFVFLVAYPLLETIYVSFFSVVNNIDGRELTFVGFRNYYEALNVNTEFKPLIFSFITMELTYVPAILIVSLIIAVFLNSKIKLKGFFRVIFFFPVVIMSGPVMKMLSESNTLEIMDTSNVLVFQMVNKISPLFSNIITGILNNFTTILWFTGIPVVLFLNALQRINVQLYEAADIDGANKWQILWKISVPNLKSTILLVAIYSVIQIALFEMNPIYSFVVVDQISKNRLDKLGFASSVVLIYSVVIISLVLISFLLFREKREVYAKSLKERQTDTLNKINKNVKKKKGA